MDKKIIDTIITNILHTKKITLMEKCPTWLSKPTNNDKKFLSIFFNDNNDPKEMLTEDYYENYRETDRDIFFDDIKIQQDYDDSVGFTDEQLDVVGEWGWDGYTYINGKIYNTKEFRDMKKEGMIDDVMEKEIDNKIDTILSAIEDGPNIQINSLLYRGGHWDARIKVGDVVTQKGFASLSYDETEAKAFADEDNRYNIEFYVPSQSKGIWLADPFDNLDEAEYLTPPDTRFYVFDIDETHNTAKVVILP